MTLAFVLYIYLSPLYVVVTITNGIFITSIYDLEQ